MTWADAIEPTPHRRIPAGGSPSPAWLASPAPFYAKLQQILEAWRFDRLVDGLCARFYAGPDVPGAVLNASTYFRLLMIGLFEGIDSDVGIAWWIKDSGVLRCFLGGGRPMRVPDVAQVAQTRLLIDAAMHDEVFQWVLTALNDCVTADATEPDGACLRWARVLRYPDFLQSFLGTPTPAKRAGRPRGDGGRTGQARRVLDGNEDDRPADGKVH
jgi:hypothetical protein